MQAILPAQREPVVESPPLWPGLIMASLGAVCFAGKAIIAKLAYRLGVDAMTLIMLRMLFAFPLFLLLSVWSGRGKPPLTRRDMIGVVGLGFCGYYVGNYLDFAGLSYISASLGQLIVFLNPTAVLVLGAILFKHRVTARQVLAMALSYAGVLVVVGHDMNFQGRNVWLGALLSFGSAISYALYLLFSGEEVRRLGAMRLTGLTTSVACAFCIGQFLIMRPVEVALTVQPEVLWLSALNGVLCTFAPVLLVMMAVERIGAAVTAQMGMIGPLSTILMSALLLDDRFSLWTGAGAALVIGGVWMLTRSSTRHRS